MRNKLQRWLGLAVLFCPLIGFSERQLTEASFEEFRQAILPSEEEQRWLAIDWRATFWDAVQEARDLDRPVLLWAMNGHPLACT
jgi:hypothetical protein